MSTPIKRVNVTLTGTRPLLQHNGQLADPLNPHTQALAALTKKRMKTIEDHEAISRTEFEGGLYFDPQVGPYVPGGQLSKVIHQGGKAFKLGPKVLSSVFVVDLVNPLIYDGPRDVQGLWDADFWLRAVAATQTNRIVRTRPIFQNWSVDFAVDIDTTELDLTQFESIMDRAGGYVGIGDWRPTYGRFTTTLKVA